jgi:plasmid stabilization system protein ParE
VNLAKLSLKARQDIRDAAAWIARDDRDAARRFRDRLRAAAVLIGDHAKVGRVRPDLAQEPIRFLALPGFPDLVVYDSSRTPPLVLRVLHGARDLPELMQDL